jgi:hypothetical protein
LFFGEQFQGGFHGLKIGRGKRISMDYLSTRTVDKPGKKRFFEKPEQNRPMRPAEAGRQGIC